MNHITLQKVDESNFLACFSLKLEAQQEKFVSHPIRSLAQAYVYYSQSGMRVEMGEPYEITLILTENFANCYKKSQFVMMGVL